jgi:predicted acylesterase/phospholipase RssA
MRIVSLDGGGIKGVMTARILERLEAELPGWIASTDLFAGTSTGGILALAIASGMSPTECVELYRENGKTIFSGRGLLSFEYFSANYDPKGLRSVLEARFGNKKLKDLAKQVLVPAFDLRRWCPKFFDRDHDGDASVVDVALATSSAPTYFPAHGWPTGPDMTCYADGGLFANNPSDSAIAFARSRKIDAGDLRLVSFGTGDAAPPPPEEMLNGSSDLDWGYRKWIVKSPHYLFSALFDGGVVASHFRSREQLGSRYCRVQPVLTEHIELDSAEKIGDLLVAGERHDLAEASVWLEAVWGAKRRGNCG